MSKLTSAFAALAAISVCTSAYFWVELRAERTRISSMKQRLNQLELTPSLSFSLNPHDPANAPSKTVGGAGAKGLRSGGVQAVAAQQLMEDRDRDGLTKSLNSSLRASLAQNYPELARDLGLAPEQAGKILDIVAKYQIASMSPIQGASADDNARRQSAWQESQREQEAEIAALIGYPKSQEWKEYHSSMPARQRVNRLDTALESVGLPLTELQHRQLVETILAVQKRHSEETRFQPAGLSTLQDQLAYMRQAKQETDRQILDEASSYLSPGQVESLRKVQDLGSSLPPPVRVQRNEIEAGG